MNEEFSPSPESPVLVIGASGLDVVGRLESEIEPGTSNPSRIRTSYGGVARNVAENLARLGHPVTLISVVGEDRTGDQLLQDLSTAGVNIDHVLRCTGCPTGSYLAIIDPKGEMLYALDDMRAMSELSPEILRAKADLFKDASLLFIDGNLSDKTIKTAFSLARRARIPVCADPTSAILSHKLLPYLDRLKLITPNSNEAGVLCNQTVDIRNRAKVINAAKHLVSLGVDIVIVTLAQYGVCYATSETNGHLPAIRTEIVDPIGAGDALTAAVIFALLNEIPLDEAVRLGVTAASLTLRCAGTVDKDLSLEKLYDGLVI